MKTVTLKVTRTVTRTALGVIFGHAATSVMTDSGKETAWSNFGSHTVDYTDFVGAGFRGVS